MKRLLALCLGLLAALTISMQAGAQTAPAATGVDITIAQSAAPAGKPKREPTPAMRAARERQKVCSQNWRADKAAGRTGSQKWPQYWSACNKRLKATAGA